MAVRAVASLTGFAVNGPDLNGIVTAGFVGPELPDGAPQAATFNINIDVDDTPGNIQSMICSAVQQYALDTWQVQVARNKVVLQDLIKLALL